MTAAMLSVAGLLLTLQVTILARIWTLGDMLATVEQRVARLEAHVHADHV